jgi:hypothetical protein
MPLLSAVPAAGQASLGGGGSAGHGKNSSSGVSAVPAAKTPSTSMPASPTAAAPGTGAGAGPIINALRHAGWLIQQANHDYQGFRLRAMKEVTAAIQTLEPAHQTKIVKKVPPAQPASQPNPPQNQMSQAASDAQLQQAQKQLQSVLNQLNAYPQGAAAVTHVQAAIQDLDQALKLSPANQNQQAGTTPK